MWWSLLAVAFADPLFSAVAAVSITNDVLTFTNNDWDTEQQVQIGGVNNDLIGLLDYTITASVVSGPGNQNSGGYRANAGLTATITGELTDNDGADVSLVTNPVSVIGDIDEGDPFPLTGGFFEISLSHQPASDVVVSVIFSDPSLAVGFGSDTKLTFTSRDWNTVKPVNFAAQQDTDTADNDYTITLDVISGPAGYVALDNKELTGTIIDDDTPGFTLSPILSGISEGGGSGKRLHRSVGLSTGTVIERRVDGSYRECPVECG